MTRRMALVLGAALLAGCARPTMVRQDMSNFDQDHYQCFMEVEGNAARQFSTTRMMPMNMYALCMKARGYHAE